jgi:hypothetical protein
MHCVVLGSASLIWEARYKKQRKMERKELERRRIGWKEEINAERKTDGYIEL